MKNNNMSIIEIRSSVLLALILSLRLFGLFLILPVFSIYAKTLVDGDDMTMVGLAMGIYGLTQAFWQIPLGIASDKYGRKPILVIGLVLFSVGAVISALTDHIMWIIIGRAIQGTGAISAVITAFIADSTRAEHRVKAMAIVGLFIGLTFASSLVISPLLYKFIKMKGIFYLMGVCAIVGIYVVLFMIPSAPLIKVNITPFRKIICHTKLVPLNCGVFFLHMIQMAMFVTLPTLLEKYSGLSVTAHWKIYLPMIMISLMCMLCFVFICEKYKVVKQVLIMAIIAIFIMQIGTYVILSYMPQFWRVFFFLLLVFFIAFNVIEACQPALVSRIAPINGKGAALGIYNTLQALGLFCGGILGGWQNYYFGAVSVFLICAFFTFIWLLIALSSTELFFS